MSKDDGLPWKVGTDLFGGMHVYDANGERLSNDRMCGSEDWAKKAHILAAAPDLLKALEVICHKWAGHSEACESVLRNGNGNCDCDWPDIAAQCDAAIAKATKP